MTATLPPATAGTATRDTRTFWRVLLAVLAPLPLLGMGLSYIIMPFDGGDDIATTAAAIAAHPGRADAALLLSVPFLIFLIPATVALAWTTRRHAPRLTAAGACVALLGFLAAFPILPGENLYAQAVVDEGLDVGTVQALDDALWAHPMVGVAILLFLAGLVIGLPILGVALWRSRVAPAWLAACLIAGTVTHPFIPGHLAQGIGLLVGAVGFLGVSRALLRMRNDDFDLPPAA
jgi:hypothetical protein